MAYDKHTWNTKEPITKSKMQHIEDGIESVAQQAGSNTTDITTLKNQVGSIEVNNGGAISDRLSQMFGDISNLQTAVGSQDSVNTRLDTIETAIYNATENGSKTLQTVITELQQKDTTIEREYKSADTQLAQDYANADATLLTQIQPTLSDASTKATQAINAINGAKRLNTPNDTLSSRFFDAEDRIGTLEGRMNTPITGDERDVEQHLSALKPIGEEVVTARGIGSSGNARDNLNARFVDDEERLSNAEGRLTTLETSIPNRFGTVEGRVGTAEGKITAIETRLTGAEDIYGSIDARFDAVESKANDAAIASDVTSAFNDVNTRLNAIDGGSTFDSTNGTLAAHVVNLETAIDYTPVDQNDETPAGLTQRITTVETTIGDNSSGIIKDINDLDNAIDHAASGNDPGGLTQRISVLESEPKSATVIIGKNSITYNNDGIPTNIGETPSQDKDYLLQNTNDDKYYYWKYLGVAPNGTWHLISSANEGGQGTSSAEFYDALTSIEQGTESETVDYFIGGNGNYIHYRYRNNEWVQILPTGLINNVSVDTSSVIAGEGEEVVTTNKSRPIIKAIGSETNLLADFNAIQSFDAEVLQNNEGYKLTWVNIDGESRDITITGGGGGASSGITSSITRIGNGTITSIIGETCEINFKFIAKDSDGQLLETVSSAAWSINRVKVATSSVYVNDPTDDDDYNTFDITSYLQNGDNNIVLTVTTTVDDEVKTATKTWTVNVKNFTLVWDYDESTINEGANISFSCTPYGIDMTKILHLKVGINEQTKIITTNGIPTTISITNNFSHGVYTAEMWMTTTINESPKTTPHIFHDFIVAETGNTTPIIAATLPSSTVNQYDTIAIPFVVYNPVSTISTVTLAVDGTIVDTRSDVGRVSQTWYYTPATLGTITAYDNSDPPIPISGTHTLTITSGVAEKTLIITVNSVKINNQEIDGYVFKLKASELPSNNALQNWTFGDYTSAQIAEAREAQDPDETQTNILNSILHFSDNFDWINGGIQTEFDENDQIRQYIRVKSGTTMTIPYKMFSTDPRTTGSNFKIIFKIDNCRNYDATVITNTDQILDENEELVDNIGIKINAHNAVFKSTTTEINTQYGEEEYTELEFEVYKATDSLGNAVPGQYMMAWVDGVITTARKYGGNFVQTENNRKDIVIGSNDCDICIYLIKYYIKPLTRNDHINNFIADAPNAVEMVRRFNRNDILDEDEDISYEKLAEKNRDCRVWLYDIERMTKAKDDPINVYNFQQIWENGDKYYQLVGTNAKLKIQGTSSFNYRYGAANTDIDFGKKKAPNATLIDGYGNNLLDENLEYPGFKINNNSLPITYSNTKVNFASCEQVNNMCNAEWYQRYQPFPSLSARDCMEFAMGVQFIKDRHEDEPSDGIPLFEEKGENFKPNKYYMYSIANMGTSKKNTHIFHSENECCIEIKENTSNAQRMKSFDSAWTDNDENVQNYEMRYPDIKNSKVPADIKNGWARFVQWMAANNPGAALESGYVAQELPQPVTFEPYTFRGHNREVTETQGRNFKQVLRGVTISQYAGTYTHDTFEYRMAKMLSECEDYMAMDSVIYHFCYIERHTMVDNVAKNTFWSSAKEIGGPNNEEGYWIWDLSKNYDNDTSDGNNNNGLLVFDYGNEATDTRNGTPVFNGSDTVWFVFASNLYEACRAMFVDREAIGAWSSTNYHNYLLNEQRKVPERVWNECYWYDYLRTYEAAITNPDNETLDPLWIGFLDGGQKTHQRKHYETYEEIYDSSKYRGSLAHNQAVVLRGEAIDYETLNLPEQQSKFNITMFNKCYLTIWIGTNYKTVKCEKGIPTTVELYEKADTINYSEWEPGVNYIVKNKVNYNGIQYACISTHTSQIAQTPDTDTTHWKPVYLTLSNSVIEIDSGSMIQAIGDLSQVYPSSGQFAPAKRLRSLQIGSDVVGYYNPNMNNSSILTFNNKMLEYLYVQNLPQANYNLDLGNCPELKYINAGGSGFTGFVFANGGLLNEAYINNPSTLVMRNLDYLTNANFHLTTPTVVTSLRLEGGKLFDKYTFINQLTNLSVLRLTGINWSISTKTILDRLINLMGIDETGATIDQSYLAGTVSLTGTTYEGDYNRYTQAWSPDLTINTTGSFIHQHLVTYYNYNGIKLYETYINSGGYDSQYLIDPYASGLLEGIPTKPADVENIYIFGQVDNANKYRPFSGWKEEGSEQSIYQANGNNSSPRIPVTGDMNIYAVYSSTKQRYKVRWLLDANRIVAESEYQNYGSGYDLISPTIKDVQALYPTVIFSINGTKCTYSIMTGWEKLPTNITPTVIGSTYDIYATWLERKNVDYNTVLTNDEYSVEEKLLVLQKVANARNSLTIYDRFPIRLGYDGLKPAIDLVSTPTRYTGDATTINNYEPFAPGKSFTMAIDYRFEAKTSTTASEAVLLSCYSETDQQGFKLYYNPQGGSQIPQISFGSTASSTNSNIRNIGSSITNRNIVVLRHKAGENILYVYTGSTTSGLVSEYTSNNFRNAITWSANASDAKIVLGGINTNNLSSMNATGTLYSVKYWEEDLGEGECLQLANWCHETINFAVADYDGNKDGHSSIIGDDFRAKIVLHALNASEMGTYTIPPIDKTTESTIGWNPSAVRALYNNRIYYSLPTLLQSIMATTTIQYRVAQYNDGTYELITNTTPTSSDYVFAPSCIEVGANSTSHSTEASGTFGWYSGSQFIIQQYNNNTLVLQSSGDANYTNLRFPYYPLGIGDNATTIYIDYPITGSSFYIWLQDRAKTLKTGDILIPAGETVAYMYVSSEELNKGAPIIEPPSEGYLADTIGGWIESTGWWTRSVPTTTSNTSIAKFQYINDLGVITTNNDKTHGIVYSIGI